MPNEIKREFIGEADSYQKTRPNYPQQLFVDILNFWNPNFADVEMPIITDVGCGTGIATRGIFSACKEKCKVIGMDPDPNMLKQAKQPLADTEDILYLEGNAEKLPFDNLSIDIVIVAQAMQYFDRPTFYKEAVRVLRKSGVMAIIENNRSWKDSQFLEQYENFLEKNSCDKNLTYYTRDYRAFPFIAELKPYFKNISKAVFLWSKTMTPADFLTMIKSSTSGQQAITNIGAEEVERQILELTETHLNHQGLLEIPYISKGYFAKN